MTFFGWHGGFTKTALGSSSQALAPLGARVSVAPRPLTETEIRGGGRGREQCRETMKSQSKGLLQPIRRCKGMYSIKESDGELKQVID